MTHHFVDCLERSHSYADAPWWDEVYHKAFPTMMGMLAIKDDSRAQRDGIDRLLLLANGHEYRVDEKVREVDFGDIALEVLHHNRQRKWLGWLCKEDLACDFIAYAFAPTRRCFLLPFQTLRRAWLTNRTEWVRLASLGGVRRAREPFTVQAAARGFCWIEAKNRDYWTRSIAVPIPVLLSALGNAMAIDWGVNS